MQQHAATSLYSTVLGKKNFIKYKEKGSKIAVCSESGSNVWCVNLKRSETRATIHVWTQFKYLALKYFGLDDSVVLLWSIKNQIVFTMQFNKSSKKDKKKSACLQDYEFKKVQIHRFEKNRWQNRLKEQSWRMIAGTSITFKREMNWNTFCYILAM